MLQFVWTLKAFLFSFLFFIPSVHGALHSVAPVACRGPLLPTMLLVTVPVIVLHFYGTVCDKRKEYLAIIPTDKNVQTKSGLSISVIYGQ